MDDLTTKITIAITCIFLILLLFVGGIFRAVPEKDTSPDLNIYLNETTTFAKNVDISVVGIAVLINQTEEYDEDGDLLSEYILSLQVEVEQTFTNWRNGRRTIKPSMFKLKSVNLEAKGQMKIFFESLAITTLSVLVNGALGQFPNIIENTATFAESYFTETIKDATERTGDFKPIKLSKEHFENKKLENNVKEIFQLDFPIKQEYLESNNVIVLAIDTIWNLEKRIFLTTRP